MTPEAELSQIKRGLVPWLRGWEDAPIPPPADLLERLEAIVARHPTYEAALREAVLVHSLAGNRTIAIALLRRIIALPGPKKPKIVAQEKERLASLLKLASGEETHPFPCKAGLTREQFLDLGAFLEHASDTQEDVDLSTHALTRQWARDALGVDHEGEESLCRRLIDAGAFTD